MFLTTPTYPPRYVSSRTQSWSQSLQQRRFAAPRTPPRSTRGDDEDDAAALLQRAVATAAAAVRLEQERNPPFDATVQARFITASYFKAMGEPYPVKRKDTEAIGPDGHILSKDCTASFIVESYLRARAEI